MRPAMQTPFEPRAEGTATLWQDMRNLARFVAEAAAVSGAIILGALIFL